MIPFKIRFIVAFPKGCTKVWSDNFFKVSSRYPSSFLAPLEPAHPLKIPLITFNSLVDFLEDFLIAYFHIPEEISLKNLLIFLQRVIKNYSLEYLSTPKYYLSFRLQFSYRFHARPSQLSSPTLVKHSHK